jgi:hypothetical protein
MKTLTITEGRGRLGYWVQKAIEGKDVAFVLDGKIVALRPVTVHSDDYALQEYGVSESQVKAAARRIAGNVAKERRRRSVKPFNGNADDLRD